MYRSARTPRPSRTPQRIRSGPRTPVACVNCKEKKLKCDDRVPSCYNCLRFGLLCLIEDPSTKRQQPRNYLETLEERVALLESMLREGRPYCANDHLFQSASLISRAESCQPSSEYVDNEASSQSTFAEVPEDAHSGFSDLSSKVGMLSLNAAGAEPHYLGSSSAFTFSRFINYALRRVPVGSPNESSSVGRLTGHTPSPVTPCSLPDYDTAVKLSNAYFQSIHLQYPFLHEPTFRAWEENITRLSGAPDGSDFDAIPLFFLNMVYAVGALLIPNCGYSAERLYVSAQLYADYILPFDNIESIQAILCCAVYSLRSSVGTSHWKLAGLALRQCVDLGYHRNTRHLGLSMNPLRLELRKRVFWCAYIMECAAAFMLGRPLSLQSQAVDAEFPLDINDSYITDTEILSTPRSSAHAPSTNMTKAICTFRIRLLWGRILTSLYSDTAIQNPTNIINQTVQLRTDIDEWRASIPSLASPPRQTLSLFENTDFFDLEYNYTLLQLYRVQIIDFKGSATDSIFLECLQAAESICRSYRRQLFGKRTGFTWGALHELFLAGLTYLHCLWTCSAARESTNQWAVSNTCNDCTTALVIMAERWEVVAPYRDIFEALTRHTMVMLADNNQETPRPSNFPNQGDISDTEDLTQWAALITNAGISQGLGDLLNGLMGDSQTYRNV